MGRRGRPGRVRQPFRVAVGGQLEFGEFVEADRALAQHVVAARGRQHVGASGDGGVAGGRQAVDDLGSLDHALGDGGQHRGFLDGCLPVGRGACRERQPVVLGELVGQLHAARRRPAVRHHERMVDGGAQPTAHLRADLDHLAVVGAERDRGQRQERRPCRRGVPRQDLEVIEAVDADLVPQLVHAEVASPGTRGARARSPRAPGTTRRSRGRPGGTWGRSARPCPCPGRPPRRRRRRCRRRWRPR